MYIRILPPHFRTVHTIYVYGSAHIIIWLCDQFKYIMMISVNFRRYHPVTTVVNTYMLYYSVPQALPKSL